MKITKSKLQQLIKEELNAVLREQVYQDDVPATQHPTSKPAKDVDIDDALQLPRDVVRRMDAEDPHRTRLRVSRLEKELAAAKTRIYSLENHVKANWKVLQQKMEAAD